MEGSSHPPLRTWGKLPQPLPRIWPLPVRTPPVALFYRLTLPWTHPHCPTPHVVVLPRLLSRLKGDDHVRPHSKPHPIRCYPKWPYHVGATNPIIALLFLLLRPLLPPSLLMSNVSVLTSTAQCTSHLLLWGCARLKWGMNRSAHG